MHKFRKGEFIVLLNKCMVQYYNQSIDRNKAKDHYNV